MVLTGHAQSIESPNRQLNLTFHVDNGIPYYSLLYKGKIIIEKSRLGFEMKNIPSMVDNFSILKSSTSAFDETWEPVWGEVKKYEINIMNWKLLWNKVVRKELLLYDSDYTMMDLDSGMNFQIKKIFLILQLPKKLLNLI